MTNEIQRHEPGALAGKLNREQVDVLKSTICKGATDAEMALFLEVCKAKRLDPFSGQIHALKRREKNDAGGWDERLTWQVGIDGFRALAERTGERDGMDPPEWCGDDGVWQPVWLKKEPPRACRVRVYRKGVSRPYETVALWDFYVQTTRDGSPNRMWQRGGPAMLAKCAEALALRMAFPLDLGDLYAPEEIGQAANEPPTFVAPPSVGSIIDVAPSALGPFRRCLDCRVEQNTIRNAIFRARRREGLCAPCGQPSASYRCESCLAKYLSWRSAWEARP